ncbi:syntaxin-10-like isoform X2 [Myxocyprinus asiaticus]|uniref:syntaxin-10-like isoform X2 n=1 Tax=Myxocyprinus asiaticus TaxID=70543 RepID=UPI0022219693|nr:syntaxin-10-like isoform X2 [Myxocyprinus asiaticus]XP_051528204.1 syntaxin-10-like isoform X2 [Myxocyprinus asiaticus]
MSWTGAQMNSETASGPSTGTWRTCMKPSVSSQVRDTGKCLSTLLSRQSLTSQTVFLDEGSGIVEANPGKFHLGEHELQERREFVERTRNSVQLMKEHLASPSTVAQAEKKNKQALLGTIVQRNDRYAGLEPHLVSANSRYIQEQQEQQQLIMQDQDEQLELVSGGIRVLKDMSNRIGDELDEQAVMLGEFSEEMDQTGSRMDSVLKKVEKVSHMTSSRRQWCAIGVLVTILIVVLIMFFAI